MKNFFFFLSLYSILFTQYSFAQNTKIDSLLNLLKTDKEDTNKVVHLNKLCWEYKNVGNYKGGLNYAKQALALSNSLPYSIVSAGDGQGVRSGWAKGIAASYNNIGVIYYNQGNYPEALKNYLASLKIFEELGQKQGIATSYYNLGNIYSNQGNYPLALKNYYDCLKIMEEIGDKKGISTSYNSIGIIYYNQVNYPGALKNYYAALKIQEEIGNKKDIANSYNNIGIIYYNQGNYSEALKNLAFAFKKLEEINDKQGIAIYYNNIGSIYMEEAEVLRKRNGSPDSVGSKLAGALKNYFSALKMQEDIGDKEGIATSFINLGNLQTKMNKLKEGRDYLNKALQLSKEIGSKDASKDSYAGLAKLDSITGNFKAAFEHHKLFIIYRDSLDNEETKKKTIQSEMTYEFEKKEIATKAEQNKLDAISAEEKQKQNIIIYAVAGVLILVIIFSLFLFNRFRITQRQKNIIEMQKVRVDKAYEDLHEKNKEVMDSIYYARRIQRALITSEKYISNHLNRLMRK